MCKVDKKEKYCTKLSKIQVVHIFISFKRIPVLSISTQVVIVIFY